jgi:hypothetical protein
MGDLLSRAPEEIAFFSRTMETSQDISMTGGWACEPSKNFETFPVAL